ncbi:hypothetical protein JHK82_052693 [Glycine max]|nr:hypothetical protein JHK85_053387 [Glycine max]KAG5082541.1 hypothetical protein JHK84_052579 [Glycine max]KAG5085296.1 hypothetical protein JHK82_052693 [Glycine max]
MGYEVFISILDDRYDEFKCNPDFMKEYIFPGGCLPYLSRITSAMAATYPNYGTTKSEILDLGFHEKFIRTWEYYFDYCGASFKSLTLEILSERRMYLDFWSCHRQLLEDTDRGPNSLPTPSNMFAALSGREVDHGSGNVTVMEKMGKLLTP